MCQGYCIWSAAATGVARHLADQTSLFTFERGLALDDEVVRQGQDLEQIPGAGVHAVATGRALVHIDNGQPHRVHRDGIERAGDQAVVQPQTAPGASLAAAAHQVGSPAAFEALVLGDLLLSSGHCLVRVVTRAVRQRVPFVEHRQHRLEEDLVKDEEQDEEQEEAEALNDPSHR